MAIPASGAGGVDPSTAAAVAAMQQAAKDNAILTGANASFQGQMQTGEVTNNAMSAATGAASKIGSTNG